MTYYTLGNNEKLCPVKALQRYVEVTKEKRESTTLFVSFKKPYASVSTTTIGRWLKETLTKAGIEGYSGHSMRAASTSAAKDRGVPVSEILRAGSWSRESTFSRFYSRFVTASPNSYSNHDDLEHPSQ